MDNITELLLKPSTGVLLRPPEPTDYIAGDELGFQIERGLLSGDWAAFLPSDESQNSVYFDSMACVTFSALNSVETQMTRMLKEGLVPLEVLKELQDMGFFDANGKFNASDRFTAKMSGTTRAGNYLTAVWDSIRNHGVLPEKDWAYPRAQRTPVFDWDDYYAEIPQALKDKAKRFTALFETRYQWLVPGSKATQDNFKDWLQMAPIQLATAVCSPWNTSEVIPGCNLAVGHATLMFNANQGWYDIEDHYRPYQKRLALDYPIPHALLGVLSVKSQPTPTMPTIDVAFSKRMAGQFLLAVEDHGALWYVTPQGKRVKIGNKPEEVEAFLQAIRDKRVPALGISNSDLSKIANV